MKAETTKETYLAHLLDSEYQCAKETTFLDRKIFTVSVSLCLKL